MTTHTLLNESEMSMNEDTLDLHLEILRIVHTQKECTAAFIFSHATLAMDLSSLMHSLQSLTHSGLLVLTDINYTITAKGLTTILPSEHNEFPLFKSTTARLIRKNVPTKTLTFLQAADGSITLSRPHSQNQFTLSHDELFQLWQKLNADFHGFH